MCGTNLHILGNTTVYEIWETFVYVSLIISHPLDVYEERVGVRYISQSIALLSHLICYTIRYSWISSQISTDSHPVEAGLNCNWPLVLYHFRYADMLGESQRDLVTCGDVLSGRHSQTSLWTAQSVPKTTYMRCYLDKTLHYHLETWINLLYFFLLMLVLL